MTSLLFLKKPKQFLVVFILVLMAIQPAFAQINSSGSVPNLPALLLSNNGNAIKNKKDWEKIRRPEIAALVEKEIYGFVPDQKIDCTSELLEQDNNAIGGTAIRKQIKLSFKRNNQTISVEMLVYLPKGKKHFPTFLGYNFNGNETIYPDAKIHASKAWTGNGKELGKDSLNWPVASIIQAGCGVATMYYWDIAPDKEDFSIGIYPLFYQPNQLRPSNNEWGALAAWAWGLSRALDYLQTDKQVDGKRVIVIGHSRLGKASLWAGAKDQRFAGVISSGSGAMGVSISKDKKGETLSAVIKRFPRWNSTNFKKYLNQDSILPFDQHMVVAMLAPRPLYIASASEDQWADPSHEYLSAVLVSDVYHLYGYPTLSNKTSLPLEQPIAGRISHHVRIGKHDILPYDWNLYLQFANRELK